MTPAEKNVKITQPWLMRACRNDELFFAALTIKQDGMVQLYRTDEIPKADLIKQLRHIADALEQNKIIMLGER